MTNVDTVQDTDRRADGEQTEHHDPVPAVIDWLVGLLTGVIGVALMAVGVGMYTRVDREMIADAVAEDGVSVDGLTESEFITAAGQFVDWFAVGVVLTGLVSVVAAVGFVLARRRTRHRVARDGGTTATLPACAVYGAVVTALVSFVPGSAIAGGGAAAYLYGDSGVRTGATAGLLGAALTIPLLISLAVGILAGAGAVGELSGGAFLVVVIVGAELIALAISGGLGALGGFLVDRFA